MMETKRVSVHVEQTYVFLNDMVFDVPINATELEIRDKALGKFKCNWNNSQHFPDETVVEIKEPVIIEVQGGVAEVTQCPEGVEVEIIDHDNEGR